MKHFTTKEFDSPDLPGSGSLMDPVFLQMLDSARDMAGVIFKITSGYRTVSHNKKVGGSTTSSHLKGIAADIAYNRESTAVRIIAALSRVGFLRIGKGEGFIHVDLDMEKPHPAYWDYDG